jgi:hypothetical protein
VDVFGVERGKNNFGHVGGKYHPTTPARKAILLSDGSRWFAMLNRISRVNHKSRP